MPFLTSAVDWREACGSHLSVPIAECLRHSLLCSGRCKDFRALGITACALHLPRCSFIFTLGLSPPPWGCCSGQMLHVALPRAAPCRDVFPTHRRKTSGLLGELGSGSWAVGPASL